MSYCFISLLRFIFLIANRAPMFAFVFEAALFAFA